MLDKKAVSFETIGKWIVALIIIGLLWVLVINLGDFLYGTGNKAACENWVARNSVSYIKEVTGNIGESPCVTTEEVIKDLNENKIYEQLANNMYDCWDQYGRGEADFYSNFDFGSADTCCRICSEIKFDDDVKKRTKAIDVDKFEIYLSTRNPPNNELTYAEFLTGSDNAKLDFGTTPINIESGSLYTTFLVYKHSSSVLEPETGATTLGFTLGACYVGAQIGAVVGTVFAPITGTTGCAIGMMSVLFTKATSIGDSLYPSIVMFRSDSNNIAKACDYVYYNPEEKPFEFIKK